jgi:hypothetical protein
MPEKSIILAISEISFIPTAVMIIKNKMIKIVYSNIRLMFDIEFRGCKFLQRIKNITAYNTRKAIESATPV